MFGSESAGSLWRIRQRGGKIWSEEERVARYGCFHGEAIGSVEAVPPPWGVGLVKPGCGAWGFGFALYWSATWRSSVLGLRVGCGFCLMDALERIGFCWEESCWIGWMDPARIEAFTLVVVG